jgi:hypothetical protein
MEEIKIAIQGNSKRGEQVIKELEKLGGQNSRVLSGTLDSFYYYIGAKSFICCNTKECVEDYFQRNNDFRTYHKTVGQYYTLAKYKRMKRIAKIKSFINKKHE